MTPTVWLARRVGERILCGRQVDGRYVCQGFIAPVALADLRRRGVTFEDYTAPQTVDGIAQVPVGRAAWFRDPEGNLIGMVQFANGR